MSIWTTPKTWAVNELVTAALLNAHLRDNQIVLKNPPTQLNALNQATDFTTTSTTWVDVDGAGQQLELTMTTFGGDVMVSFRGNASTGTSARIIMDVDVDGTRATSRNGGNGDGLLVANGEFAFTILIQNLPAGSHTFKLVWRLNSAATGTLYMTGTLFKHNPQFWAREVS